MYRLRCEYDFLFVFVTWAKYPRYWYWGWCWFLIWHLLWYVNTAIDVVILILWYWYYHHIMTLTLWHRHCDIVAKYFFEGAVHNIVNKLNLRSFDLSTRLLVYLRTLTWWRHDRCASRFEFGHGSIVGIDGRPQQGATGWNRCRARET